LHRKWIAFVHASCNTMHVLIHLHAQNKFAIIVSIKTSHAVYQL